MVHVGKMTVPWTREVQVGNKRWAQPQEIQKRKRTAIS